MNRYHELYPESNTRFALALLSSPTGPENLQFLSWLGAQFHALVDVPQDVVYGETYVGELSQGKRWLNDDQLKYDVKTNASQTPASLVSSQSRRLLKGISKIDDGLDVTLLYAGDRKDGVVEVDKAIKDIPIKTGRPLDTVFYMTYPDLLLQAHAGLWWVPYIEANRGPIEGIFKYSQEKLGFNAKAPQVYPPSGLSQKGINRPQ